MTTELLQHTVKIIPVNVNLCSNKQLDLKLDLLNCKKI